MRKAKFLADPVVYRRERTFAPSPSLDESAFDEAVAKFDEDLRNRADARRRAIEEAYAKHEAFEAACAELAHNLKEKT